MKQLAVALVWGTAVALSLWACNKVEDTGTLGPAETVACGECAEGNSEKISVMFGAGEDAFDEHILLMCFPDWMDDVPDRDCVIRVELVDATGCPWEVPGVEPVVQTWTDADQQVHQRMLCPLPSLGELPSCAEAEADSEVSSAEAWYMCRDDRERFQSACDPQGPFAGIDEDGDGLTDCDDGDCLGCPACGGDGTGCLKSCQHAIRIAPATAELLVGNAIDIQCARCDATDQGGARCGIEPGYVGRSCEPPADFTPTPDSLHEGIRQTMGLSEQCGGDPCLTIQRMVKFGETAVDSHCTCRCGDLDGHDHAANPELCECPEGSVCEPACEEGSICPELMQGSFCQPACLAQGCEDGECTAPPEGAEDASDWICE